MPTSAVVELQRRVESKNGRLVMFSGEPFTDSEHLSFQMTKALWADLGSPEGLRVRIEDTYNDPNRLWATDGA